MTWKLQNISPIFKKNDLEKKNYGSVSALLHMSKVFKRIMYTRI